MGRRYVSISFYICLLCALMGSGGGAWASGELGNDYPAEERLSGKKGGDDFGREGYVAHEIIVKFRESAAVKLERGLGQGMAASQVRLSDSLDEIGRRYPVRNVRRIFQNFKEQKRRIERLRQNTRGLQLNQREERLRRRLKRARQPIQMPDLDRIYTITLEAEGGPNLEEALEAYRRDPEVEYAELNYIVTICRDPNDTHFPRQWALHNKGQMYPESGRYNDPPGTPDSDIDAPEAWERHRGTAEAVVAVLDTGVDYTHRDLVNNLWINPWERDGAAGVDDDGNGYVDDIYGYDFFNEDNDPQDDYGHGTHCAGIIGAEGNNGLDVAGVSWQVRIMGVKFLNSSGSGSTADGARAIYYAVNQGAEVLSNSWGDTVPSAVVEDAVNYAYSQGAVVVAAAGNNHSSNYFYPAKHDHVIAVAATDSNDNKATFSTYGVWVDLAAPGVDILSLRASGRAYGTVYDSFTTVSSGTSMACPYVAGACGFLLSVNPLLSAAEITGILTQTGDPTAAGISWSNSRLNLNQALSAVTPPGGAISLDKSVYSCVSDVSMVLVDGNWVGSGNPMVVLRSSGGDIEEIGLSQAQAGFNVFEGMIITGTPPRDPNDGILQVDDGETITVEYFDPNDGTGTSLVAQDSAVIDGVFPTVSMVAILPWGQSPRVFFETDEPTTVRLKVGLDCPEPNDFRRYRVAASTSHQIDLTGVAPNSDYFFVIEATDAAGNTTVDDNGGVCYGFTTNGPGVVLVPGDYPTIQEAISFSWDGGEVRVADGRYTGTGNRDIDFEGRAITVKSENGPENCIIDVEGSNADPHRGFYFHRGEGDLSVVEGFTITNGYTLGNNGGGILMMRSSPTIRNCVFSNNSANFEDLTGLESGGYGGAMYIYYGNPVLTGCEFIGNSANYYNLSATAGSSGGFGGGIYAYFSNPKLIDCTFQSNEAKSWDAEPFGTGGAMRNYFGQPWMFNCRFMGNTAQLQGGGIGNYNSHVTLVNCLFSGNTVEGSGGAIYNEGFDSEVTMINCTVADNTAGSMGGGVGNSIFTNPTLTNCILWGNSDGSGDIKSAQIVGVTYGTLTVDYSCVQDNDPNDGLAISGTGNIDVDPDFVAAVSGDYHLQSQAGRWDPNQASWVSDPNTSGAIDAGDPTTEWTDELWPDGGRINMGAYGGTAQASMSLSGVGNIADLNHDGMVNGVDWVLFSDHWQRTRLLLSADLDRNGMVDLGDLGLFQREWLWRK